MDKSLIISSYTAYLRMDSKEEKQLNLSEFGAQFLEIIQDSRSRTRSNYLNYEKQQIQQKKNVKKHKNVNNSELMIFVQTIEKEPDDLNLECNDILKKHQISNPKECVELG